MIQLIEQTIDGDGRKKSMDSIEQRVDIMEKRLESVEDSQDRLTTMQGDVLEILKGQREEILEIRQQTERLSLIQLEVTEILRAQNEELKLHREELQESKRFNRQTRQLWVIIARKMDWLDEDLDIDSL